MAFNKIIKWTLNIEDMENIVDTISLVDEPAIEVNWMAFKKEEKINVPDKDMEEFAILSMFADEQAKSYTFDVPEERFQELRGTNTIVAPAMIADKLILRMDEDGSPYYGFFDAEAISNAAYAFQKYKLTDQFNINHDDQQVAEGVYLAETWLVQDTELDKSNYFGYRLPRGSWMTVLRIDNDELYREYIDSGLLNGLSVEAFVLNRVILNKLKFNENGKKHD